MYKEYNLKRLFKNTMVLRNYSEDSGGNLTKIKNTPKSRTRLFKKHELTDTSIKSHISKTKQNKTNDSNKVETVEQISVENTNSNMRINEMNVQMLSKNIYKQIFGNASDKTEFNKNIVEKCRKNMKFHGLNIEECPRLEDVDFKLPKLQGADIIEHFYNISEKLSNPYRKQIEDIVNADIPSFPKQWVYKPGWHQYKKDGSVVEVPFPPDDALVFDVEICVKLGPNPVIACAVSPTSWYGWVSQSLIDDFVKTPNSITYGLEELIPMESTPDALGYNLSDDILSPKIIIGHNVSFDRARIKEQYWMEKTGARFLDTMSMHICISGITSYQRAILKSKNKPIQPEDENWIEISSLNSLSEVHKLYCGKDISKALRDVFIDGYFKDVRENFQELMTYCANDVLATASVLKVLYPMFKERFPHPATLAGMLELGTAYLPVNSNWLKYINSSDLTYEDVELESKLLLEIKANEACKLMHDNKYKTDMWMWDQDWSVQQFKLNKNVRKTKTSKVYPKEVFESPPAVKKNNDSNKCEELEASGQFDYKGNFIVKKNCESIEDMEINKNYNDEDKDPLEEKFAYLFNKKALLPAVRPLFPGYPAWYRKLCTKPGKDIDVDWSPGPINISTSMQITPKLLSLTWEGYPLHYIKGEGWGFLVPFKYERSETDDIENPDIPLETLVQHCPVVKYDTSNTANKLQSKTVLGNLWKDVEANILKKDYYSKPKKDKTEGLYTGTGIWSGIILSDSCYFMKLPHKDGVTKRVGNPLSKDFLNKFSENVLSGSGEEAKKVLTAARMLSYWRNNRERIKEQNVMWFSDKELPLVIQNKREDTKSTTEYGAILPLVVVCGTLTRRAMEPTWMTASNAHNERIGSELRAMVQSPSGYSFVGADVDSQELWIAAILGDSQIGIHGGTPFGWMTLSGSKAAGTDLHSHTATTTKITRDHAKVLNYARIYGAGQNFAERLLKQFNPSISDIDAKTKARKMFTTTKGKRICRLNDEYVQNVFPDYEPREEDLVMSIYEANTIAKMSGKPTNTMFSDPKWVGGTESAMFNQLEEIAGSDEPKTPFLNCQLTRSLMADEELRKRHLPTAVNWVVQSGAVDFLHLMLVNMAWLTGSKARFCISFHDEIRYMLPEKLKYNGALALHITNLFTRAFCAKKLGFSDLPQSVAFFSSVDVDTVLRKESHIDCVTPSNPHGLSKGYGIPLGESLDIWKTLEKSGSTLGELFTQDETNKLIKDESHNADNE